MLTESLVRGAEPREKAYKLFDSGGLFIIVNPNGSRWWRLKYRYRGKERGISLGVYPLVSLRLARLGRDEARALLADGIDPSYHRQREKRAQTETFELVAQEWLQLQSKKLAAVTIRKARWILGKFVYPHLGARPVSSITAPNLLAVLRKIEERGIHQTAHRTNQRVGQILRYAIATGRAERDVSADLRGALAPMVTKNHAAITEPARIGELMCAIAGFVGDPISRAALRLLPLVFVRPGELRNAEWREIDLRNAEWRIPGPKMKMRTPHIVPLARQALDILRELEPLTGSRRYAFASGPNRDRPMPANSINRALRWLGYSKDEMTAHGFRAMASTALNELGWNPDLIELQLAHVDRNKVRAAYNRASRLAERRAMMQAWADYLDVLRATRTHVAQRDVLMSTL
jgi:integrase